MVLLERLIFSNQLQEKAYLYATILVLASAPIYVLVQMGIKERIAVLQFAVTCGRMVQCLAAAMVESARARTTATAFKPSLCCT